MAGTILRHGSPDRISRQKGLLRALLCRRSSLARRPLMGDRRAVVAVWVALIAPLLTAALSLGIEVSNWSAIKVEMQRAADVAALAGVMYYSQNGGQQNLARNAATYAARIAEINSATGTSTPTWNGDSKTLIDNTVTVQMLLNAGLKQSTDNAIKVTVQKSVPLMLSGLISNLTSVTVTASSWAEIVSTTASTGPQPCLMALSNAGITNDITFTGSVSVDSATCSIRSNSGVSFSGSVSVNTAGVYAATTVTQNGSVSINGPIRQNAGTLPDPYASNTTLQNALTSAASATGPAVSYSGSSNVTLNPGNYTGISVKGSTNVTMNPGLYVVNGNVSFAGSTNINGNGVTIISTGTLDASGSSNVNLTAATTAAASHGAVPGILFASKSTSASVFSGSSNIPFTGVIYYPNGEVDFYGSSTDGSSGCAQVIAGSLKFTGSVSASTNCTQYGTAVFGSQLTTTTALQLVK